VKSHSNRANLTTMIDQAMSVVLLALMLREMFFPPGNKVSSTDVKVLPFAPGLKQTMWAFVSVAIIDCMLATFLPAVLPKQLPWLSKYLGLGFSTFNSPTFRYAGFIIGLAGFAMREWAKRTLGRFFTYEVTIREDHKLVDAGPYRCLRHPSYTAALLWCLGVALFFNRLTTWAVFAGTALFLCWRIPQEEKVLANKFGDQWKKYAAKRWRLVPCIF